MQNRLRRYAGGATFLLGVCCGMAWAASEDAKQYIEVRKRYEPFRCQQVKLMRAQGDAANAQNMEQARQLYQQRMALIASAEVRDLETKMAELRGRLMDAQVEEDYDAVRAAEGELRQTCR